MPNNKPNQLMPMPILTIRAAVAADAIALAALARQTFVESHGHSASANDIAAYVEEKYTDEQFKAELANANYYYHLIYAGQLLVGFSKVVLNNAPNADPQYAHGICKLERLYVLQAYYASGVGKALMQQAIDFSKTKQQQGMWLYVWIGNERATRFYFKLGFEIIGSHDFRISATHTNPNHQLYLKYKL